MRSQRTTRWRHALVALSLIALYLLPRLTNLDSLTTTDEPYWLGRSANFYTALWQGRLEDTFQFAHPGVMTMWMGMIGYWFAAPDFPRHFTMNIDEVYEIHLYLRGIGLSELDVLIAARFAKILLQAALFGVAILYLGRRFGTTVAAVAGVMIALDPFLIAHDRLLQVDGVFAIASFAAVMALADAVASGHLRVWPWIAAGILAAIAWLTRSTGIVLVGVVGIVLFVQAITDRDEGLPVIQRLLDRLQPAMLWGTAALVTTVALWPALWVDPITTLLRTFAWAVNAAQAGHEFPTFFMGTIHPGDPGAIFYPVSILWRITAIETIGLVFFVATLAGGMLHPRLRAGGMRTIGILALFAALYIIGMTIGAKKFDRYILPVYPVLNLLAAIGIVTTLRMLRDWRPRLHPAVIPTILATLLLIQAFTTLAARPYYLGAYNSLLGGADAAQDVMQMGWGEGVSEAADFIIADTGVQPGDMVDDPPVVRSSGGYGPPTFALPLPYEVLRNAFQTEEEWLETDYYIATIQQWQRDISGDVIDYLAGYEPVHTVWVEGVEYVRVYDLEGIPPPDWLTGSPGCEFLFQPNLLLKNIVIEEELATFWFRTMTLNGLPDDVTLDVRLVPRSDDIGRASVGASADVRSGTFAPRQGTGLFTGVTVDLNLPAGTTLDHYLLELTISNAATGEVFPAVPPVIEQPPEGEPVTTACGEGSRG